MGYCTTTSLRISAIVVTAAAGLAASGADIPRTAAAEKPAAFCYFTSDGSSYVEASEMQKLAELVELQLAARTDVTWVERTRLPAILDELKLSASGMVDSAGALRLGRLLKADLLIKGSLTSGRWQPLGTSPLKGAVPPPAAPRLLLEVVDLARADVLAARTVELPADGAGKFKIAGATVEQVGRSATEAVAAARNELDRLANAIRIAPLYFRNAELSSRLDFFEADLREKFRARNAKPVAAGQAARRYLQFPHAHDALDEANLIATGLVESDREQWNDIADYYVWGTYREVDSAGVEFPEVRVAVEFSIWDGRKPVRTIAHGGTVKELKQLIERIAVAIESETQAPRHERTADDVRKRTAEDLRLQAADLQEWVLQDNFGNVSAEWLRRWGQCVKLLATASFLDPTNEPARRELVIETTRKDVRALDGWGTAPIRRMETAGRAWKAYCDQFGFGYVHVQARKVKNVAGFMADNRIENGAAWMYLLSAEHAVGGYMPDDTPADAAAAWRKHLEREYRDRIRLICEKRPQLFGYGWHNLLTQILHVFRDDQLRAEAVEAIWPVLLEGKHAINVSRVETDIRKTFATLGRPERADSLLADARRKWPDAKFSSGIRVVGPYVPGPIQTSSPLATVVKVTPQLVTFHKNSNIWDVTALAVADERIWIGLHGQFFGDGWEEYQLFARRLDGTLTRRLARFQTSRVTAMLPDEGRLWVAQDGDGIRRLDPKTEEVESITARDGSPTQNVMVLKRHDDTLFAGGGEHNRGVLGSFNLVKKVWVRYELPERTVSERGAPIAAEPACQVFQVACDSTWMAASTARYQSSTTQILVRRRDGGSWTDIVERLRTSHFEFSHFQNAWRPHVIGLEFVDEQLWVATTRGLIGYDPKTDQFTHLGPTLGWEISAMAQVGDRLWCVAESNAGLPTDRHAACLAVFDTRQKRWEKQLDVPELRKAGAMTLHGDTLWIGQGRSQTVLLGIDVTK
jgi:hypothetical protein